MNQPFAHVNQPYETLTLASALHKMFGVQLYKNNARHYFRVFWVSWIQIGCSIRVGHSECMNDLYVCRVLGKVKSQNF